ncbi:translocation/assembly module TamB domain-containing protein [Rhodoferax sp. PAMC 29310]|uniref:translocation/assembly module TamB domain-containing protein n=1 Tax=Rhodoferax sp. PAMC 29310 TaxID=2822760 RepID=UPI001B32C767|nr:translocation/assembly module TamB domain-containing protein [Rhodoferax sp. PAMC 29310]
MKVFRYALLGLLSVVVLVLALLGGAWLWGGSATSLSTLLARVGPYLPADQSLSVSEVTGSLRDGGRIGSLRWRQGELSVEATDVELAWTLRPLWDGELRIRQVTVQHLRVDDQRPPSPSEDKEPPSGFSLPIKVSLPFAVNTVEWMGPPALVATELKGSYQFNSTHHTLDLDQVLISSGKYALQAKLEALAPMAVEVKLQGTVSTEVPGSGQAITVTAKADITGELSHADSQLALQAQLLPALGGQAQRNPQATLNAQIQPWNAQPLAQAKGRWQSLNLAALWPQAPKTDLSGEASVTPAGSGWQGSLVARNSRSGPWDQQSLPLQDINAQVMFDGGRWLLKSLQAKGAGGELLARGEATQGPDGAASPTDWKVSGTARQINPAALDTRLDTISLDGALTAEQGPQGIRFEASLQPSIRQTVPLSKTLRGLRLKAVQASGLWRAPTLQLDSLLVQTDDAKMTGQATVHTQTLATQGQLALVVPGAQANLAGRMTSADGDGALQFKAGNAAVLTQWLARLPGMPKGLTDLYLQGGADLSARWQGGWQKQGQALNLKANIDTQKLDLFPGPKATEATLGLRDTQLTLTGTLRALELQVKTKLNTPTHQLALQSQLQGGQQVDGQWQAQINTAKLTAKESSTSGTWTAQLTNKVSLNLKQDATRQSLAVGAGALSLTGPVPGTAQLNWQAANWSRRNNGKTGQTAWATRGNISQLPLGWIEFLGKTPLVNLGLRGDLVFGGQWDAVSADALNLTLIVERSSGDLQLLGEDGQTVALSAGLRDARLVLTANNENLGATLIWDSQRAGRLNATASTRLPIKDGLWTWTPTAPLAGKISAELPPVGAWSLLAPPGWRLSGTLDADTTLSGTLGTPLWHGRLQAKDMAVRSVVDGIDFSQGTLTTRLDGQRLIIDEFALQGAGGAQGGQLSMKGLVEWLPAGKTPPASPLARLRMDLDASLKSLRMSSRVDRRLIMSGQLTARLADNQLAIRGALTTDEALIILPDDSAPQLGKDVVVRGRTDTEPASRPTAESTNAITPDLLVTLDLGPDFQVKGRGLSSRLAGKLTLTSSAQTNGQPRLTGTVSTVRGTFKAYGQELDIEEGVLRFTGPYDNPSLNVLALRSKLSQRVGVQINGTARSPVVRLYADPELPEAEKLAWLVLGRSPNGGGAETALLQQAALALMGRNDNGTGVSLAQRIGLDELSVGGGTGGVSGATLTVGKRLSQDFYVAYETGLAGAVGTLQVFYDLSRRFTLRATTGNQSAVDLIFTHRYD